MRSSMNKSVLTKMKKQKTNESYSLIPKTGDFLSGPQSRINQLVTAIDIFKEFIKGFRALHFVGPCITVFGSARFDEMHPYYQQARTLGRLLAQSGFTVLTGGGPGIMEAANRGAFESGGRSVGCNIVLPQEQKHNPYMHKWVTIKYFFVRKVLLTKYSYGFIVMPGGVGTMDEFFETLTLIQTKTIKNFPLVVIGKEYYTDILELMTKMQLNKAISPEDLELVLFTDDVQEATDHIKKYIKENYSYKKVKPRKFLNEKT